MENFDKILNKITTTKGIMVLIIAAALAFFIYKNFDFITEITFKIDRPKVIEKSVAPGEKISKNTTTQDSISIPVV
jgi:hypothetical protein